ncbi:M16 family metallopeptidase [Cryomorpha ignava]|nr:pitrilysin family protein [Cryomorpha ignava]
MKINKMKSILLAALFISGGFANAQKSLPENFYFSTLDNGMELLVIEDQSVPLATIELAVHNGAYTETPEYDGLSHLYEHMFFKANKDIPSQEKFMERVNELGISFNGTTSFERVNYFITLSSTKLSEGLEFMNSAIRYPLFLEEEMKKENPVVDGEFQRSESNPVFFLLNDMSRHLWKENYSRKNTIGDHDIILTATPEKMRTIQERYYYPNNTILVVAGAVDHEEVEKKVKALYGDWKKSDFDIFEENPIPEMTPLEKSESFITLNENARVPIMMIGQFGPSVSKDPASTYAADVFHTILNLESSNFQKNLVQSGMAYQAGSSYQTLDHTGPIQTFFVPNPQKMKEAIAALEAEVAKWNDDDYFTDEQIEAAKNQLAIQDIYSRESTSDFVHSLTFWWASADLDYYVNYIDNLKKVTRADMKKYVETYIQDQPNVTGILLSPEMQKMMAIESIEPLKM